MKTLGERNNNPLNIRKVPGTHWKGELPSIQGGATGVFRAATKCGSGPTKGSNYPVATEVGGGSFVRFSSIEFGLRAAFVLLRTYSAKYHANCIRDIISRWAPPTENDTEKYIKNVCLWTGLGGLQRLTEEDWPKLVRAMGRQECGALLDEGVIQRGFDLYREDR